MDNIMVVVTQQKSQHPWISPQTLVILAVFSVGVLTGYMLAPLLGGLQPSGADKSTADDGCAGIYYNDYGMFNLASYYSSHMVLQREPARAVIWGYAPKLEARIQVDFNGSVYNAKVYKHDVGFVWSVKLESTPSGGPHTIAIRLMCTNSKIILDDVLFGDVWILTGQSNMAFSVQKLYPDGNDEFAEAHNYPDIRLFSVGRPKGIGKGPRTDKAMYDLPYIIQPWTRASEG